MSETIRHYPGNIYTGPEFVSNETTLSELKKMYGGKAAWLIAVQKYTDIPTAKMIVGDPSVEPEELIEIAIKKGIKFPWIVRPSTEEDDSPGSEGRLPTEVVFRDDASLIPTLRSVQISPQKSGLGIKRASVIVSEFSDSRYRGASIDHPHNDRFLIAGLVDKPYSSEAKDYSMHQLHLYVDTAGVHRSVQNSPLDDDRFFPIVMDQRLSVLQEYYQELYKLPGADPNMTLQLEFGSDDDVVLYQVRDFLPRQQVDFRLDRTHLDSPTLDNRPMVFGITPPEGIDCKVLNANVLGQVTHSQQDGQGLVAVVAPLNRMSRTGHIARKVNIFTLGSGMFFGHEAVRTIRQTDINIFINDLFLSNDGPSLRKLHQAHITSDGENVTIEPIS